MKHTSVPSIGQPIELINVDYNWENPLISKCQIKVCYVGDEPNRNRSIITKDVAREMAKSLPGSAIVGYFNEENGDFEEHSRELKIEDGKVSLSDITRPYGFVDLNAKCWFQKFIDDNENEHEYLMTEGYLWTGQYPEANRIIEQGNNQSMELDEKSINAFWTKDNNGKQSFFIINEAIISKLCILGEDFEPCFEGSTITKVQFSLGDDFQERLFSMVNRMKEILNEGGENSMNENENLVIEEEASPTVAEFTAEEPVVEQVEEVVEFKNEEEEEKITEEEKNEDKSEQSDNENSDNNTEETTFAVEEVVEEKKYSLDEIPEYMELTNKYAVLEQQYNDLLNDKESLTKQINELKEYKLNAERVQKKDMIDNTFYMLSDEDKKDVVEHIDEYSLDEIEAKLSILCVRNKVSFAMLDDETEDESNTTFNINSTEQDETVPAWVKAVLDTAKNL